MNQLQKVAWILWGGAWIFIVLPMKLPIIQNVMIGAVAIVVILFLGDNKK